MITSFGSWPCLVDWDRDGDLDLLIGSFRGGLYLRSNIGMEPQRGVCSQIDVVDVEGDGKLDLLVGDYSSVGRFRTNLDFAAKERLAEIRAEEAAPRSGNDAERTRRKDLLYTDEKVCTA